jgi:hypothetical protein
VEDLDVAVIVVELEKRIVGGVAEQENAHVGTVVEAAKLLAMNRYIEGTMVTDTILTPGMSIKQVGNNGFHRMFFVMDITQRSIAKQNFSIG